LGFWEGKTMKKVTEQVAEIVKDVTTVEQIAEIERIIGEAKGKILPEPALGFWEGKTPCWEMFRCPEAMKTECPAFKYRSLPCWEIEGTYGKLYDYGAKGDGTDICQMCRVYKRWGHGESIEIKLLGKGFNTSGKQLNILRGKLPWAAIGYVRYTCSAMLRKQFRNDRKQRTGTR